MSLDEFDTLWRSRGPAKILRERIQVLSNMEYRRARISLAEGRRTQGLLQMTAAAAFDPVVAAKHLYRIVTSRFFGRTPLQQLALEQAD